MLTNELKPCVSKGTVVENNYIQPIYPKINCIRETSVPCDSLFIILDQKNKRIAEQQEQLTNQKRQLDYYLSKGLKSHKIFELAQTCSPQALEENIPVSFAVNKFYKSVGLKSKISSLHDKMCSIDHRINHLLQNQQCMLGEIIYRLKNIEAIGDSNYLLQAEVFRSLLNATISLSKKLDTYRICCDRLILIEDERNEIVEHVYSLPIEQRLNCNYIISIQTEKNQLENEMKVILQDQALLRQKIYELGLMDRDLIKLQQECQPSIESTSTEYTISRMLEEVNIEAFSLLQISQEYKQKLSKQMAHLKEENKHLINIFKRYKENEFTEDISRKINEKFAQSMFIVFKNNLNEENNNLQKSKLHSVEYYISWNQELGDQLHKLEKENRNLSGLLDQAKREYKINLLQTKSDYENETNSIRAERDSYKEQVDDLLAIRAAYAQLIEKQTDVTIVEGHYQEQLDEKDRIINGLILQNEDLKNGQAFFEDISVLQKNQIEILLEMVQKLTGEALLTDLNELGQSSSFSSLLPEDLESDFFTPRETNHHLGDDVLSAPTGEIVTQKSEILHSVTGNRDKKTKIIGSLSSKKMFTCNRSRPMNYSKENTCVGSFQWDSIVKIDGTKEDLFSPTDEEKCADSNANEISDTTFRIRTTHKDGTRDIVDAVLKNTSKVEDVTHHEVIQISNPRELSNKEYISNTAKKSVSDVTKQLKDIESQLNNSIFLATQKSV